ncbi:uncharacterized protein [Asterias amurensis]|uniref:uncharacterized protein isoform X1 n=1 Tax=Asterias amurensis TaxID=7602 RepID=UPI003AB8421E
MATGDLKGNLRRLQTKLKTVGYPKDIDVKGVSKGLAQEYLPLLHYILLDYSRAIAQLIINNDMELYGKNDNKFVAAAYKVLRDIFHYKPSITRHQFFSRGFAEHKIMLLVDIIRMVTEKNKELCKAVPSAHKGSTGRTLQTQSSAEVFGSQSSTTSEAQTPFFGSASTSEIPVFLPTVIDNGSKVTDRDTGYHTAETSPTAIKNQEAEEVVERPTVSVNELCAKFEHKGSLKHDSIDSKLSDSYLEEHPVIQALVDQIVHLEDHIAVELEKRAKHEEEFEALVRKCDNMSGHIVILQHKIKFVENKLGATPISVVEPLQSSSFHSANAEPMHEAIEQDSLNLAPSPSPRSPPLVHSMPTYEPARLNASRERSMEARPVDVVGMDEGVAAAEDEDEGLVDDDGDLGEYIIETSRDCSGEGAEVATDGASGGSVDLEEIIFEDLPVRDVDEAAPSRQRDDPHVYSQIQRVQNMLASTQQMLQGNAGNSPPSKDKSETN